MFIRVLIPGARQRQKYRVSDERQATPGEAMRMHAPRDREVRPVKLPKACGTVTWGEREWERWRGSNGITGEEEGGCQG